MLRKNIARTVLTAVIVVATLSALADADEYFSDIEKSHIESLGPWPATIPSDPGNQFSGQRWAEHLGEKLFFDKSLSRDQTLSCASCHQPPQDFSDGRDVATGALRHVRNTQGLLNVGLQRWFGWDGGSDSLWAAALRPILSDVEMANDIPTVANRLRKSDFVLQALTAAGVLDNQQTLSDEALVVLAGKTIGAYTRTLVSSETAFDRYRLALLSADVSGQADYPAAARRGLKIFIGDANCSLCHFGANFSNGEFHDTGRPFFTGVGQVDPGRYTGIKRVKDDRYNLIGEFNGRHVAQERRKTATVKIGQNNFGQWRTPSLRNLTRTAPYMHDGSLPTLRDVVDAYADIDPARLHSSGESILKPLALSDAERNDLVAFLRTLSVSQQ